MSEAARLPANEEKQKEPPEESAPEVLTVDEAAKFLRIGRSQLYDAIGRKEIPHQRIGRSIRLSKTALVAWLGGSCDVPRKGS